MANAASKVSQLSKRSHVALGSLVAGAGVMAAASAANAEMIGLEIYDINKTAKNGSFKFDLNKDGFNDFRVVADSEEQFGKSAAFISGLKRLRKPKFEVAEDRELEIVEKPQFKAGQGSVAVLPNGNSEADPFAKRFPSPGQVDGSSEFFVGGFLYQDELPDDGGFMPLTIALENEEGGSQGEFTEVGDVGYIGLALTFGEQICCEIVQRLQILEEGDMLVHMGEDEEFIEGPVTFYGWAEVVRGSLTVNRIGFQTIAGAAAPIPGGPIDVPEPATLPLLALGAAGLAAMRRRKAVAA